MSNLFFYQREVKRKVKGTPNEDGSIPVDTEVTEIYWDCFNIGKVIRGHWTSPEEFTVMLDDGHEQADDVQKPVFKGGKMTGVEVKRERAWYMSQIPLNKEDAERFRNCVEAHSRQSVVEHELGKSARKRAVGAEY